jgi:hypothetical protein
MNLRYDLHFAIRVKAHMQPPLGAITSEALVPTFRAARREMLELHVALQRVLVNFGYDIDLDSLRGKLRTSPENEAPVPPPGMALPPVNLSVGGLPADSMVPEGGNAT